MAQTSRNVINEPATPYRPPRYYRRSRKLAPPVPELVHLTEVGAQQRLLLMAILQSRDNCRQLLWACKIINAPEGMLADENRTTALRAAAQAGQLNMLEAMEFLDLVRHYTDRRAVVPSFLRDLTTVMGELAGDQAEHMELARRASELQALADEIDQTEGQPQLVMELTDSAYIIRRLVSLLSMS